MKERRKHIEKPWNTVHHFGTEYFQNTISFKLESSNTTTYLKEPVQNELEQWFDKGIYQMNVYRYDAKVIHEIDEKDSIVAYWPRPSSSNVLEGLENDSLLPRERIVIDYLDRDSCVTHGYIYELLDASGNTIGWLPNDTTEFTPRFEYTILSRDSLAPVANINEGVKDKLSIDLFPNPSSNFHTLRLKGEPNANYTIVMYDLQGRKVSNIVTGVLSNKKTEIVNDVSPLANGLYVYHITIADSISSIKFIKQ